MGWRRRQVGSWQAGQRIAGKMDSLIETSILELYEYLRAFENLTKEPEKVPETPRDIGIRIRIIQ